MGISDRIETFIIELLNNEEAGWLQIQRNEMAEIFGCAPSQINYVISTRFNPSRGYAVESKRGGGGYLRIRRIPKTNGIIEDALSRIGTSLDFQTAAALIQQFTEAESIDERTAGIIIAAVSDRSIPIDQPHKDIVRAAVFKNILSQI